MNLREVNKLWKEYKKRHGMDNNLLIEEVVFDAPEEVEAFYYRSNLIRDCLCSECVINGKPAIQLEVLANPGVSDEDVTKETERIGKELPSYMQPAKIALRHEEFEKSPSMKIIRK